MKTDKRQTTFEIDVKKDMEKLGNIAKETGQLAERLRIMAEIDRMDLPVGVWSLLRKVINPNAK